MMRFETRKVTYNFQERTCFYYSLPLTFTLELHCRLVFILSFLHCLYIYIYIYIYIYTHTHTQNYFQAAFVIKQVKTILKSQSKSFHSQIKNQTASSQLLTIDHAIDELKGPARSQFR
jgi:hypothetical protein